jgi:hypothetical protein
MERIKKPVFTSTQGTEIQTSSVTKWIPFIFAGVAAGIGVIALHEIKNVKKELIAIKKEQNTNVNDEINKRMENMENQLKTLTNFITNKNKVEKDSNVIKNVVQETPEVTIINEDEYEEIEVTDDEAEN